MPPKAAWFLGNVLMPNMDIPNAPDTYTNMKIVRPNCSNVKARQDDSKIKSNLCRLGVVSNAWDSCWNLAVCFFLVLGPDGVRCACEEPCKTGTSLLDAIGANTCGEQAQRRQEKTGRAPHLDCEEGVVFFDQVAGDDGTGEGEWRGNGVHHSCPLTEARVVNAGTAGDDIRDCGWWEADDCA